MSEITDERIGNCADDLEAMADIIMVTGQSGRLQAKLTMLRAARHLRAATPSSQSLAEARRLALEEAAKAADQWGKHQEILLRCGEMTAQELRTAVAVANGIAAAIRALSVAKELPPEA